MEKQRLIHKPDPNCVSARLVLAIMAFLGFAVNYALRVNMSVAIVAMTNWTDVLKSQDVNVTHDPQSGEFYWSSKTQGHILGSFYYGYLFSSLIGRWLATSRLGGKYLLALSILTSSVLTLLTPVTARWSLAMFIVIRILQGICGGVTFPAIYSIWGHWVARPETNWIWSITFVGGMFGTVITFSMSSVLDSGHFLGGWPSIFYVFGALGCLWSVAWVFLGYDSPDQHPRISAEEKRYIETRGARDETNTTTPWGSILRSPAVIAICVSHLCGQFGFYLLLQCLPIYMRTIHELDIKSTGLLSAVPYLILIVTVGCAGSLAETIDGCVSTANTRKLMTFIGLFLSPVVLIASGLDEVNTAIAVFLMTVSVGLYGCVFGGFGVNHMDVAPRFAGAITHIKTDLEAIPAIVTPLIAGYMTHDNHSLVQWRTIFFINGGISLFGCIFYCVFAKGEEQPWAREPVATVSTNNMNGQEGSRSAGGKHKDEDV